MKSTQELIAEYRWHATEHAAAIDNGDSRRANKHYARLLAALHSLRQAGHEGSDALLGLLSDENASVRCWAATHCLKLDEQQARRILQALCTEPGIVGLDAEMVLAEWEKGTLEIP